MSVSIYGYGSCWPVKYNKRLQTSGSGRTVFAFASPHPGAEKQPCVDPQRLFPGLNELFPSSYLIEYKSCQLCRLGFSAQVS